MKRILFYPMEKWHSVYNPMIEFLSKHFILTYFTNATPRRNFNPKMKYLYYKYFRKYVSLGELKGRKEEKLPKCDLIFASNTIPPFPHKYILSLENVTALGGYDYNRLDKEKIKREFESERCKAIICWNEMAKESLIRTIDCSNFKDKIHIIPFAIKSDKIIKRHTLFQINLLFVSSINNPYDFESKGGIIALEIYKRLCDKYFLNFYVRAEVPKWIKKKYGTLRGLTFIDKYLPNQEMKELYLKSDILLEPIPGINVLLESMNYAIPAVAFNFWMTYEMILDGRSGFIIDTKEILGNPANMEDYLKNLNIRWLKLKPTKRMMDEYAEKVERLISDWALRKEMSKNAKALVSKDGFYSLQQMKFSLLSIFNKAVANV